MGSMLSALATLLALAAGGAPAARAAGGGGPGRIADEVVAVVRFPSGGTSEAVTLSRLVEEARIALVSRGATRAAVQPLDGAALRAGLAWLIDQMVVMDEVTRLNVFEVDRDEAMKELRAFRGRFGGAGEYRAFLERLDLGEEELLSVLRRMLRVQRYVESRVKGAVRVRDAEVTSYYQEHAKELGGRALNSVREAVRAHLVQERIEAEVKTLLRDLRSRCEVRLLADLDEAAGGA